MQVETYLFGAVEVSPEKVITFPNGLVAFEDNKRFMLAHESDKGQPASYTPSHWTMPAWLSRSSIRRPLVLTTNWR